MWELRFPRTVVIGEGALEYLKEVKGKRVLIVTEGDTQTEEGSSEIGVAFKRTRRRYISS